MNPYRDVLVPSNEPLDVALPRTTHMGIGAHQDDLEIMALHGILNCYQQTDTHFGGITCTDGAGCSRAGLYADYSDDEMARVRMCEQRKAAVMGDYSAMFQLGYSSGAIKQAEGSAALREEITEILLKARPDVVYAHNPADKHSTHIAVLSASIAALRALPEDARPSKVYGCEVWRDLDWLADDRKELLDVSGRDGLSNALIGMFDSQVTGGKRYDLACAGRRRANATYLDSHRSDDTDAIWFAMDLTPLVLDPELDIITFTLEHIFNFASDVRNTWRAQLGD
ncbi:MAG: LmbE family N-acetylglucosaminyl deacetylase [Rhodothermales bacterium]|jgi:LmbE family N-acetylglucosaminyl deacetylase